MEKVGVSGAQQAYNLLRPYAFKKDLFEWMALWHYGGLFMDVKMGLQTPINNWIDMENEEFAICSSMHSLALDNAFVAMTKHHPYGLMMVKHIID
jgi:mannosyltransferase OCH1-like enzyme